MQTQELTKRRQNDVTPVEADKKNYFQPATDVKESKDDLVLKFDMPGVAGDQVELTVEKGTLTVTGHARQEEPGNAIYRETHVGDYRRGFSISETMDSENIKAEMKAGVLTVTIPKKEKAKPKRIEIAYN